MASFKNVLETVETRFAEMNPVVRYAQLNRFRFKVEDDKCALIPLKEAKSPITEKLVLQEQRASTAMHTHRRALYLPQKMPARSQGTQRRMVHAKRGRGKGHYAPNCEGKSGESHHERLSSFSLTATQSRER